VLYDRACCPDCLVVGIVPEESFVESLVALAATTPEPCSSSPLGKWARIISGLGSTIPHHDNGHGCCPCLKSSGKMGKLPMKEVSFSSSES